MSGTFMSSTDWSKTAAALRMRFSESLEAGGDPTKQLSRCLASADDMVSEVLGKCVDVYEGSEEARRQRRETVCTVLGVTSESLHRTAL